MFLNPWCWYSVTYTFKSRYNLHNHFSSTNTVPFLPLSSASSPFSKVYSYLSIQPFPCHPISCKAVISTLNKWSVNFSDIYQSEEMFWLVGGFKRKNESSFPTAYSVSSEFSKTWIKVSDRAERNGVYFQWLVCITIRNNWWLHLQIAVSHVASDNCKAPTVSSFSIVLQYVSSLDLVCFRGFLKVVIEASRRIPLIENLTITRSVLVMGQCKKKSTSITGGG
jgi:hypothetical protein